MDGFGPLAAPTSAGGVLPAGADDGFVPHPASARMPHVATRSLVSVICFSTVALELATTCCDAPPGDTSACAQILEKTCELRADDAEQVQAMYLPLPTRIPVIAF